LELSMDPNSTHGAVMVAAPPPESWGTARFFARLARAEHDVAAYWVGTVHRPAHRVGHPRLNIDGCPGCAYEQAAKA
jgi:hypothetical protein